MLVSSETTMSSTTTNISYTTESPLKDYEEDEGNYYKIIGTRNFIDKTKFISAAYVPRRVSLMTAPRKFGKTNNLLMLKDFYDITADNSNKNHYNHLKIFTKQSGFFEEHFRKYPVLLISICPEEKIEHNKGGIPGVFRNAVSKAFVERKYLMETGELSNGDKKMFEYWCSVESKNQLGPEDMFRNLRSLVSVMKKFHQKKDVIVLVDNYDSIVNKTLQESNFKEYHFRHAWTLTIGFLDNLLADNTDIKFAVVTGVSGLLMKHKHHITNLDYYNFLDQHQYVKYFGITEYEIDCLLKMDEHKDLYPEKEKIKLLYGGYTSKCGKPMHNLCSVMEHLKRKEKSRNSYIKNEVADLVLFARNDSGTRLIDRLLRKEFLRSKLHNIDNYSSRQMLFLKTVFSTSTVNPEVSPLFIPLFFDKGLLTYNSLVHVHNKERDGTDFFLQIPNEEVYEEIRIQFQFHLIKRLDLPEKLSKMTDYMEFVNYLNSSDCSEWFAIFEFGDMSIDEY